MIPDQLNLDSASLTECTSGQSPDSAEIVWMLRRAERRLTEIFDEECREVGLRDVRDTLVLAIAGEDTRHTQVEVAQIVGLDKSTLGLILDRLERNGWLTREAHPQNRKVRIPRTTVRGAQKLDEANRRGQGAVRAALTELSGPEVVKFRSTLWRVAQLRE